MAGIGGTDAKSVAKPGIAYGGGGLVMHFSAHIG
jgi:hypothetical protein